VSLSTVESGWPRISLVTPVYNSEQYLEATLQSVISQCYPNLEYIVVNDGSTDGSGEIIRQYREHFSATVEQPNQGLYAALNAGFAKSSGEIMGWLNSNDLLHINGLRTVGSVFAQLPPVEWITGWPTYFTPDGLPIAEKRLMRWSRARFLAGANRFIQQESTYWRRSLWERAGGRLETRYRAEGDFDLWVRFFRHAQLYTVDGLIGGYRCHPNALSQGNVELYTRICDEIADRELASAPGLGLTKIFRRASRVVQRIPKVRVAWQRSVVRALYTTPGPDWAPVIRHPGDRWEMGK
jgi:Glycosyl transferase family 2